MRSKFRLALIIFLLLAPGVWLAAQAQNLQIDSLANQIKALADQIKAANQPTQLPCVLSDWARQSVTPTGACVGGQQPTSELWARTVVSGVCTNPQLTETRLSTQPCTTPQPGAPSISGVSGAPSSGSVLTVSGKGFGIKAGQQPWKWDDMSGGVPGAPLEPRGWIVHVNAPQPALSAAQTRPGRPVSVLFGQTGADVPLFGFGDNGGGYLDLTPASAANLRTPPASLLIDYWMYFANGGDSNNCKLWRWHAFNNPSTENRYWGFPNGCGGSETSMMSYFSSVSAQTIDKKWTHQRFYLHADSVQSAVYFQHSIDQRIYMNTGTNGNYTPPDSGFTAGPWPKLPAGDRLSTFMFEMQNSTNDGGSRDAKQYISDIAIDNGYGAVYLGSAPTWAASTHTEYQPYLSWTDGSISVRLNYGSFPAGAVVYLYVVTNGRAVSSGLRLTLT